MKNYRKLTIWTIVTNLLIVVGAGHGIGFLILIELFLLPDLIEQGINFSLPASYDDRLGTVALMSLIGQLVLIGACLIKVGSAKIVFSFLGVLNLWIGFIYLTYNFTTNKAAVVGLITGIPFLILSILLMVRQLGDLVLFEKTQ